MRSLLAIRNSTEVKEAARWIDENHKELDIPEDWRMKIDVEKLDMRSSEFCVIGQLKGWGSWIRTAYSYHDPKIFADELYTPVWKKYISSEQKKVEKNAIHA